MSQDENKSCDECACQEVCVYEKLMYEFAEKIRERHSAGSPFVDDLDVMRRMLADDCCSWKKG